jgi:hypothetical protein
MDRQLISLGDSGETAELAPERRVVPAKQAGELRLAARGALVVERIADSPQISGGHAASISRCS